MKAKIRIVTIKSLSPLRLVLILALGCGMLVCSSSASAFMGPQRYITGSGTSGLMGSRVALSSDGNTAVTNNERIVKVWTRTGSVWSWQQDLYGCCSSGGSFGVAIALSADGNTVLVGGYRAEPNNGGFVSVFVRIGSVWTEQQTISSTSRDQSFGSAVALSSDGNTALIGSWYGDSNYPRSSFGSASVFTRTDSVWTLQETIYPTDGAYGDYFGATVALSSDGNTALISGSKEWVYTRVSASWSLQQTFNGTSSQFGSSVALSSDGNTAIIGSVYDNSNKGSATVITRSGSTWTQQQVITRLNGAQYDQFGYSVALSADGNTALIGADYAAVGSAVQQGIAMIFRRSGVTWTPQQTIIQPNGAANYGFGSAVALSSDADTAVIGARLDQVGTGNSPGSITIFTTASIPGNPQNVLATSGDNGQSIVSWTAPNSDGGAPITAYTVTATPGGQSCIWSSGPLSCPVTGLSNGASYTFSVTATTGAGTSISSNSTTPITPGRTLTISTFSGSGTITNATGTMSCTSVCFGNQADSATITATPGTGWVFSSWGGACSGATRVCSLLMNQARDVTVFFVEAPPSAPTATKTPTTTKDIAPQTPTGVKWTTPSITSPLVAAFPAATGTTYLITATLTKAAKTLRIATTKGTCKITSGKATCAIKLKTRGTWSVVITPKKNGSLGKPVKKTVKI